MRKIPDATPSHYPSEFREAFMKRALEIARGMCGLCSYCGIRPWRHKSRGGGYYMCSQHHEYSCLPDELPVREKPLMWEEALEIIEHRRMSASFEEICATWAICKSCGMPFEIANNGKMAKRIASDRCDNCYVVPDSTLYGLRAHLPTLISEQDNKCGLCGEELGALDEIHIDYIIPKSRNGSDDIVNLQATYAHCNLSKGSRVQ